MQPISNAAEMNSAPAVNVVDALGETMKQLLSSEDYELMADQQVRALLSYVEQWAENYQRGMTAGEETPAEEIEMLKKTRTELSHILSERLTLENEGGQPASKVQAERMEHVASAISRIDQVLPHADESVMSMPMRKRA